MKIGVFISSGLGNALLLIPLLKKLRERGDSLHGFITSQYPCEGLFDQAGLFEEIVSVSGNTDKMKQALLGNNRLDELYIDWFGSTRKNILFANSIARKIITNKIPEKLPVFLRTPILFREPAEGIHEAVQNLRLLEPDFEAGSLKESDMHLPYPPGAKETVKKFHLPTPYTVVQIGSADNEAPYKNWSVEQWKKFLQEQAEQTNRTFVLLGSSAEMADAATISDGHLNLISVAGKTTIPEVMDIISQSDAYVGLDSGLMHQAVVYNKPTFTIWGGSDYRLYGYHDLNPQRHYMVRQQLDCWPCNSWISPNTSRVNDPNKCPDYNCIRSISVAEVAAAYQSFSFAQSSSA